jgi:hypothetical protein
MSPARLPGTVAALLGLALLVLPGVGGEGKGEDKPALPVEAFKDLVRHDAGLLRGELARGALDVKTTRKVRALAFMIAVYADAARGKGGPDPAGLVALRDQAFRVVALAGEGKLEKVAEAVAPLSPDFKPAGKSGEQKAPRVEAVPWPKKLSFDDLMHQFTSPRVGGLGLEKELSDLAESKGRLAPQELDRLALLGHRLAMIGRAAEAYRVEKAEGAPKGRTEWQRLAKELREGSRALAEAARGGKSATTPKALDRQSAATREALDRVNTTCVRCHDLFRQ